MLDIFSRYRQMTLLAAVVFLQVLLLAFQIKREHQVRLVRVWAAELVTPFGRAGTWSFGKIGDVWSGYFGLHGAHAENARLRNRSGSIADSETGSSKAALRSGSSVRAPEFHDLPIRKFPCWQLR